MPKNAANAEVVDKGCPIVTIIYVLIETIRRRVADNQHLLQ